MSEWSSVPLCILQDIIDVHQGQRDKDAAADACRAWRQALSNIRVVQAQIDEQAASQQWTLLKARVTIGHIRLSRQPQLQDSEGPSSSFAKLSKTAWAPFISIPPSCSSLAISAFLSSSLHCFQPQLTQLQHLTMQWISVSDAAINNPLYKHFPDLECLSQLQTLHIQMHNDSDGQAIHDVLQKCPCSLQGLVLEGFGAIPNSTEPTPSSPSSQGSPRAANPAESTPESLQEHQFAAWEGDLKFLGHHLHCLASLELQACAMTVSASCAEQLKSLTRLSLERSHVCMEDEQQLQALTNLVVLNLADTTVDRIDNHHGCSIEASVAKPSFVNFSCWSALKELHVQGCSLFTAATDMQLSNLQELGSDWLKPDLGVAKLHCAGTDLLNAPQHMLSHIVSMHVIANSWRHTGGCDLLCQILQSATCVEVLSFRYNSPVKGTARSPVLAPFCLAEEHGRHLRELVLDCMFYPSVDLHALTRLTSVKIVGVDSQKILSQLRLPVTLLHLDFRGYSLFTQQHHQCLTSLMNLESVSLSPLHHRFRVKADHLPQLPTCLRHLQLLYLPDTTQNFTRRVFNDSNFIASLAGLRHLTLPNHERTTAPVSVRPLKLSDEMQAVLSTAPHLSVVDFVGRPHGWLAHGEGLGLSVEACDSLGILLSHKSVLLRLPALA